MIVFNEVESEKKGAKGRKFCSSHSSLGSFYSLISKAGKKITHNTTQSQCVAQTEKDFPGASSRVFQSLPKLKRTPTGEIIISLPFENQGEIEQPNRFATESRMLTEVSLNFQRCQMKQTCWNNSSWIRPFTAQESKWGDFFSCHANTSQVATTRWCHRGWGGVESGESVSLELWFFYWWKAECTVKRTHSIKVFTHSTIMRTALVYVSIRSDNRLHPLAHFSTEACSGQSSTFQNYWK